MLLPVVLLRNKNTLEMFAMKSSRDRLISLLSRESINELQRRLAVEIVKCNVGDNFVYITVRFRILPRYERNLSS